MLKNPKGSPLSVFFGIVRLFFLTIIFTKRSSSCFCSLFSVSFSKVGLCRTGAKCEDEVDWVKVADDLDNFRSPHWIRRLWAVQLKPTISNGDKISFHEALTKLQKFFHECNQLFQSGLDVCEEMLISSYTHPDTPNPNSLSPQTTAAAATDCSNTGTKVAQCRKIL